MDIIRIKNTEELAEHIVCLMPDVNKYVSVFCFYEDAREVISDLIRCGCTAHSIELHPYSSIGYDDEFLISVTEEDEEYQVCCQPAKMDDGRYVKDYPTIAYVFEDCNSSILQSIKDAYIFEVAYDDEDDDRIVYGAYNCIGEELFEYRLPKKDAEYTKLEKHEVEDDMDSITYTSTDKNGHYSISFYSNNHDRINEIFEVFKKIRN